MSNYAQRSRTRAVRRHYLQVAVALLMLLASCGTNEGADTTVDDQTTAAETTTSTEEDPQRSGSLILRGDGLGVVHFGQPAEEVAQTLEAIIGSPPTDPGGEAEWVEFVGWRDLGLSLGFNTPASPDYDGVSRFVGWGYAAPAGLGLLTDEGVGIGSPLAEVRTAYGDRLHVFTEPDECVGAWTYQLTSRSGEVEITGTLDRQPADEALIASAHAGIDLGC